MSIKAPSTEDIKTGFVFQQLDKIIGEPVFKDIEHLQDQCIRNASTLESRLGGGQHGLAGLAMFPAVYNLRSATPFARTPNPGDPPTVFPPGTTQDQQDAIKSQYKMALKNYECCQRMDLLLKNQIENAIEPIWLSGIHENTLGFGNRTTLDVLQYLFTTYGQIAPHEVQANVDAMNKAFDPNQPIAILFKQIEDAQRFAVAANVPFTPAQLVSCGETLIMSTGKYDLAYRDWISLPAANKTWHNFKVTFTNEYAKLNKMHRSAQQAGYHGANQAVSQDTTPDLEEAVQNFATASAADRAAFATLTETNATLNAHLTQNENAMTEMRQQMANMQQQMMNMAMQPPGQQQGQGQRGRGRGNGNNQRGGRGFRPQNQPPPQQYPPMPTMHTAPPMMQGPTPRPYPQQPPTMMQPPAPPGPPGFQPMPPYQQDMGATSNQQMYPQQQTPFQPRNRNGGIPYDTRKRYNNLNYCWSHGHDVHDNHTSQTCQYPKWGHQQMATRWNTMGGGEQGAHKHYQGEKR